jgi:hypothetical protein
MGIDQARKKLRRIKLFLGQRLDAREALIFHLTVLLCDMIQTKFI